MDNPLVSVVIPVYNRQFLIKETLFSLQEQTYPYWEAIIVDDNSTDKTFEHVSSFLNLDNRIKFFKKCFNDKKGANSSRNIGIEKSSGKYIIFLDSDDCLSKQCIENRAKIMEKFKNFDYIIFQCQLFRKKIGDVDIIWNVLFKKRDDLDRFLLLDTPWCITSAIWKKESLQRINGLDQNLLSWHDWELHVRALILKLKYKKINIIDCYYRQHDAGNIGKESTSVSHLHSHEYLFNKIYFLLSENSMMSVERKLMLCGLFFWLCSLWFSINIKKSIEIWKKNKHLTPNNKIYYIIFIYILFYRIKFIRKSLYSLLVSKTSIVSTKISDTFRKVRVQNLT